MAMRSRHAVKAFTKKFAALVIFANLLNFAQSASAQLACTFGSKGIATITYNGVSLENTATYPADTFTVTHMQLEDLNGNLNETSGQVNSSNSWNSSTNTETYTFSWGSVSVAHSCTASAINLVTTVTNNPNSGTVFDGLEIFPFVLHFPQDPNGFYGYTQFAINTLNPPVSIADYGTGIATNVMPSAKVTLLSGTATNLYAEYSGWVNTGSATYSPMMTTTLPAEGPNFFPNLGLGLQPGSAASYTNSIRFTPEGTPANMADAFASYRQAFPYQANAGQHKAIGTMYFSSNTGSNNLSVPGDGNINYSSGCGATSGNPRNYKEYFGGMDCTDSVLAGADSFQDMVLHRAADIIARSGTYGYWGTVTWDIEGEQYPQDTSYVCSPDQLDTIAPEMDQAVNDSNYPAYSGVTNPATGQPWRLVDAYFDMQIKAGLATGFCIRPDIYTAFPNAAPDPNSPGQTAPAGSATQVFPTNSAAGDTATANLLISKMDYAHNRWGGTLFYIDSMVYTNGQVLNPNVLQAVSAARPSYILMPEAQHGQVEIRNWAYSKQFINLEDNNDISTLTVDPAYDPHLVYPQASSAILINDMDTTTLQNDVPALTTAVAAGDDLMGHADYDHPNSNTMKSIYAAAAQQAPATPTNTTSVSDSFSGTALSSNYTVLSGSVGVANNTATATATNNTTAIYTGSTWSGSNWTACTAIGNLSGTDYHGGGPVLLTTGNQGYQLFVYATGIKLQKYSNGGATLTSAAGTYSSGTACLANYNGALTGTWNGSTVVTANDTTYSSGLIPGFSFYLDSPSATITQFTTAATPAPALTVPVITTQPVNATVSSGTAATFTVAASGNPTPTYQWAQNGTPISGATSTTYTTPALSSAQSGYTVAVTNSQGTVTSNTVSASIATGATCPSSSAHCWYVRADGGARWAPDRAANGIPSLCNGQADVSYAAAFAAAGSPSTIPSGGLSCAFNDLRYMWDDGVTYGSITSVMTAGDTLIIGDPTNAYQSGENAWRVGYDRDPSSGGPVTNGYPVWCRGIGFCYMAPFPSSPGVTTHVWGRNAGACNVGNLPDKTKLTRIAGGEGTGADFTADGATLDVQCLELTPENSTMAGRGQLCAGGSTDHGFTSPNGATALPNCNSHPEYESSSDGITMTNTTNMTITDMWIHNHNDSAIKGPMTSLAMVRSILESNDSAGINFDDGCDPKQGDCSRNAMPQNSSFSMDYSIITGSGCLHTVPYTGETGWQECADQSHGGYGDGIGTAACVLSYPDGACNLGQHPSVAIRHSILRYNVQDGEDFGHMDGDDGVLKTFEFSNSLSYGNGGGQIKFGWGYDRLNIFNNLILANCARLAYPFAGQSNTFFNPMAGAGQDLGLCRSGDLFSFNVNNQTIANIDHNTFIGYAGIFFDYQCVTIEAIGGTGNSIEPNCDNTVINFRNNLNMGYANYDFLQADRYSGHSGPALFCGASCNNSTGNGNDGGLIGTWNSSNNIFYALRGCQANTQRPDTKAGTSVNEQCVDPLLTNEPLAGVTDNTRVGDPVDKMFDGYTFGLSSTSPARNAGIAINGESADYVGANFASVPEIGAVAYGSTASAVVPATGTVTTLVVPVPTIASSNGSAAASPTTVTLTCAVSGCSIYYTLDQSDPTASATRVQYTGPFTVAKTTTVKAIAMAPGYTNSGVSSFLYTINQVVTNILRSVGLKGIKGCKNCHL